MCLNYTALSLSTCLSIFSAGRGATQSPGHSLLDCFFVLQGFEAPDRTLFSPFCFWGCLLLGYRRTVIVSHVNLVPVALLTLLMTRRRASTHWFYLLAIGSLGFSMEKSGYPK